MAYPYAVAALLPTADRPDGDRLSWALGYQPDPAQGFSTFSVPLSATGAEPATHYGFNAQATAPEFVALLQGAASGQLPPVDWAAYGLTAARVLAVVAAMEFEVVDTAAAPWPGLLARVGVERIIPEEYV